MHSLGVRVVGDEACHRTRLRGDFSLHGAPTDAEIAPGSPSFVVRGMRMVCNRRLLDVHCCNQDSWQERSHELSPSDSQTTCDLQPKNKDHGACSWRGRVLQSTGNAVRWPLTQVHGGQSGSHSRCTGCSSSASCEIPLRGPGVPTTAAAWSRSG